MPGDIHRLASVGNVLLGHSVVSDQGTEERKLALPTAVPDRCSSCETAQGSRPEEHCL